MFPRCSNKVCSTYSTEGTTEAQTDQMIKKQTHSKTESEQRISPKVVASQVNVESELSFYKQRRGLLLLVRPQASIDLILE